MEKFTGEIVAALKKHKKDIGVDVMRQSYKGTGSRSHRRQVWVRYPTERAIDIWLEDDLVSFSGVCRQGPERVMYKNDKGETKTAKQIAAEVAQILQVLGKKT